MDVRGIFDLFEKKKFDFEVELPPFALSLATFSLFKCGLHGSRKLPCGAIFSAFICVFIILCLRFLFFKTVFAFMDAKKKRKRKKKTLRLYSADVCFFMELWPLAMW